MNLTGAPWLMLTLMFATALLALSSSIRKNCGVVRRELVPTLAVSLLCIGGGWIVASQCIDLGCDDLNVIGSNACTRSAKMIGLHSFRSLNADKFKGEIMGLNFSSAARNRYLAVSVDSSPKPNPAWTKFGSMLRNRPVLINMAPKSFDCLLDSEIIPASSRAEMALTLQACVAGMVEGLAVLASKCYFQDAHRLLTSACGVVGPACSSRERAGLCHFKRSEAVI